MALIKESYKTTENRRVVHAAKEKLCVTLRVLWAKTKTLRYPEVGKIG